MTYEQFWEQDSDLVIYYRKAHEIRLEQQNWNAWLHGMYIYEAIADISPILHPFAKKGTQAQRYPEKPYEFKKPKKKDGLSEADRKAKAISDKIKARMIAGMNQINVANAKKRIAAAQKEKEEAGKAPMEGDTTEANTPE